MKNLAQNDLGSMTNSTKKLFFLILFTSVLLRLLAALYLGNTVEVLPGTYDQVSYHKLALRLINGYGFSFGENWWPLTAANAPTAHWSYLYTFYLAVIYTIFGPNPIVARLIQAFIAGIFHPILAYKIGNLAFNPKIGILSAAISAVYAYFIYYSASLMTESFYILAILVSLYLAMILSRSDQLENAPRQNTIKYAVYLGIALSICALLRQLILLFIPFLLLWVWWCRWQENQKSLIVPLGISVLIIGLIILPVTIFNYSRFTRFVLLNTNAGYAFFWGNHPIYGTQFEPILPPEMGSYQDLIPSELRHLDEAALDQALLKRGFEFISDDPARYIALSFSRIPAYFMFWPSKDSGLISNISRVFSFGITWPFMLYGLLRAPFYNYSRYRFTMRSPLFLMISFVVIYTLIHLLSWALIRYRLPVDAVLLVFASLAIVDLLQMVRRNRLTVKS
jgi:4-amino-4-deoxy-L-arabinose transferase-like glycosyltransferase